MYITWISSHQCCNTSDKETSSFKLHAWNHMCCDVGSHTFLVMEHKGNAMAKWISLHAENNATVIINHPINCTGNYSAYRAKVLL